MVEKLIAELAEQPASTSFAEWLRREMPPDTYIADPDWWAPRIYRAVCKAQAEQPAEPNAEPVAWTTEIALECAPNTLAFEVCAGNLWGERGVPLYRHPDPRVAEYRELLQHIYDQWREDSLYRIGQDIDRIEAALNKEG